jgi:(1->4)-alpha-D-glucan 1-alpha-D-glucosylmutase
MRRAIREVAACFASIGRMSSRRAGDYEEDRELHHGARSSARSRSGRTSMAGLFDFLRDVLTLKVKGKQESEFLLRFQQFTPPVMAKGVEDTAFYCYNRLAAMNEVGGDPGANGLSVGVPCLQREDAGDASARR